MDEIQEQLQFIGFQHIDIFPEGYLQKKKSTISLDLASIAKGYAVDQISGCFKLGNRITFWWKLVGSVFFGVSKRWSTVACGNQPTLHKRLNSRCLPGRAPPQPRHGHQRRLPKLFRSARATLFSYHRSKNRLSRSNGLVSVSIVAGDCMFADGLATAIMVMDVSRGWF